MNTAIHQLRFRGSAPLSASALRTPHFIFNAESRRKRRDAKLYEVI